MSGCRLFIGFPITLNLVNSRRCQDMRSKRTCQNLKHTSRAFKTIVFIHYPIVLWRSGARLSKVPKTFRARKAICETVNRLFWKADLSIWSQGNKKQNGCEVWRLKSSPFLRYKGNCDTPKQPVKFLDFRQTDPWSLSTLALNANAPCYGVKARTTVTAMTTRHSKNEGRKDSCELRPGSAPILWKWGGWSNYWSILYNTK